jgi:hypothetical protein
MMKTPVRGLLAVTATAALAASLAACGPDDSQQNHAMAPLLSQAAPPAGWSMDDLAAVDPAFVAGAAAPLPQAVPMRAAYRGDYGSAPAYDYGPELYYDDGYYAPDPGADDYQWLALASALTGVLGDAPPDYAFGYDGVQPWAWETGDRYLRYAEPVSGDYRYYYYEPDSYTPYLVSDPYYSYGYRDDRLVVIYDRSGRVLDARRAERQRRAAQDYFARARQMYLAAHREPRIGVAAPLWQQRRDEIARQQRQWDQARGERKAWQAWDAKNQQRLHRDWAGEALVRREAERSFSGWQKAAFKTPAPKFYTPQQRQVQLQKVAQIRRDEQLAGQQRQQRLASADRAQQHAAQAQRQQAQARAAALQRQQGNQRQVDAQLARARQQQQQHAQQQRAQAERADGQRKAQAQKTQQQAHAAAVTRQRAAREHQLDAQRGQQARVAQQQKQAQQARAAERQKAQQARAAQQRQAQQVRAAQQQKQAQQARAAQQQRTRAAQQQKQAQQARAAQQQRQAQQARAAQQQKAQQARAEQQKQQAARAASAQQRSAGKGQAAQGGGDGHGRGHGRDRG